MLFVYVIITAMISGDAWWWHYADRAAWRRRLPAAWRWALAIWMGVMLIGIGLLLVARVIHMRGMIMPEYAVVLLFVWHLMLLPVLIVPSVTQRLIAMAIAMTRKPRRDDGDNNDRGGADSNSTLPDPGRRAFLTQSLVVLPPLAALALTGKAAMEEDDFRVRPVTLALRQLPRALDGMSIAFVSDPHIGSFISDRKLRGIVEAANNLDADLVLHGGDLINSSLADLPDGIDMLRNLRGRYGVLSCEGNHDCIDDRDIFEHDTRRADVGMLVDEIQTVRVRGQAVQIMCPRWARARNEQTILDTANDLITQRKADQFSILLTHHPHAFDAAAAAGVPLTLAGHTHGGQLALTHQLSLGAILYRYYSGEYRKGDSACCVSNGVGNWFPLRVNVPAEIVHLTLTCA